MKKKMLYALCLSRSLDFWMSHDANIAQLHWSHIHSSFYGWHVEQVWQYLLYVSIYQAIDTYTQITYVTLFHTCSLPWLMAAPSHEASRETCSWSSALSSSAHVTMSSGIAWKILNILHKLLRGMATLKGQVSNGKASFTGECQM